MGLQEASVLQDRRPAYVYALCDPGTGEVRYIGKSINPEKRLRGHMKSWYLAQRSPKNSWLKSLLARGLSPELRILEEVPADGANEAERAWIARFRGSGRLTNLTAGGDGLSDPSPETRAILGGNRRITAEQAQEIRERHAAGDSTTVLAEEFGLTRHAVGNVVRGRTWPSAGGPTVTAIPRRVSPAASAAAVRATKGKQRPESVRRAISQGKKGRPYPSSDGHPRNSAKVTEGQVLEIRRRASFGIANGELAAWSGLTVRSVRNIVSRTTWTHLNDER